MLCFDEFQDHGVIGAFHLETLLHVIQEIFGAFFGDLKSGGDLLVGFEFIHLNFVYEFNVLKVWARNPVA